MRSRDVEKRLRSLLHDAGVDVDRPAAEDVERTWAVMRTFAAEPVEDAEPPEQDGDGMLAQYGTYEWGRGEHFELDMTRQLSFTDRDGEYDHMTQLHCSFAFVPTDELRALGADDLWSFGLPLDDFFARALALPGFAHVSAQRLAPTALEIGYSQV
jgi:hypothetical protein